LLLHLTCALAHQIAGTQNAAGRHGQALQQISTLHFHLALNAKKSMLPKYNREGASIWSTGAS
jgi:hypothetical protein